MQADEPGALVIPNTNYFINRLGNKPGYVILHGTAGGTSAQAIADYFASTQGTANPVSAHYVIGQDGAVVQCVAEADGAYANGGISAGAAAWWLTGINPNNITISIEHCKPSQDNSDVLTDAQKTASFTLIKHICQRWNIPMREADANGGITGHFSIDPVNRARCPGLYPWDELYQFLQEDSIVIALNTPGISNYFAAAGNMWACKQNGFIVGNAILDFYTKFGGVDLCGLTYLGLPQSNEIGIGDGCTKQYFERGIVLYDPSRRKDGPPGASGLCYLGHTNQLQLEQTSASLQNQLAQAQAANNSAALATAQQQLTVYKQACTNIKTIVQNL